MIICAYGEVGPTVALRRWWGPGLWVTTVTLSGLSERKQNSTVEREAMVGWIIEMKW